MENGISPFLKYSRWLIWRSAAGAEAYELFISS